jgi:hypothetical protein
VKAENEINLPEDFDDLSKHAPLLHALRDKGDGFIVPENYFTEVIDLIDFQKQISGAEGFTVPENYFDELNDTLSTKIALDNIRQENGFAVPADYFERLADDITSRAVLEEINAKNDAEVPSGYFDSLADRITARTGITEEKITLENSSRIYVFSAALKRYSRPVALAASVVLLIVVSFWLLTKEAAIESAQPIVKQDSLPQKISPVPQQPQQEIPSPAAIAETKQPVQKATRQAIIPPQKTAGVQRQDILDHIDLIDEATVAEFITSQNEIQSAGDLPDAAIYDELFENNADPSELINTLNEQRK